MSTPTTVQCACEACLCVVSLESAILKDEKYYCCQACASGHTVGSGCGAPGCTCGKNG